MSLKAQLILAVGAGLATILIIAGLTFSKDATRGNRVYCHRMGGHLWFSGAEQAYKRYKKWRRVGAIGFIGAIIVAVVWLWLRTHG